MKNNRFFNALRLIKRKIYSAIKIAKKLLHINYKKILIIGKNYKLLVPDDLHIHFRDGDYYEHNVIFFLDKIVKSYNNPVMIDVGASCGYYSIRYAKSCKRIFSFEPSEKTFKFLEKNIKINNIENVTTFKIGLSSLSEKKTINLYSLSANDTIFNKNIAENASLRKIGIETITLRSLDELMAEEIITIPDIIKVDIEGAELLFLKGAEKTISQYRPVVVLEYSEITTRDAGYDRKLLLNTLNLIDYNTYGIPENTENFQLVKLKDFDTINVANIILIPAELDSYLVK